jgi:hypothetical protein
LKDKKSQVGGFLERVTIRIILNLAKSNYTDREFQQNLQATGANEKSGAAIPGRVALVQTQAFQSRSL